MAHSERSAIEMDKYNAVGPMTKRVDVQVKLTPNPP